ncbi:exported hypothetical protein [Flavobacterium sp. 9R]|uniref:hypothetical protein n=1 Tax=Flavobacterium sp. 9R TaxID=2653143 RepID=UPI0012EF469B|nr:hypothetical protein [Flavobacterium sp. 9R]VXC07782.1 exported hypothetical protein [Flavobacterium sp. 9R]
MKTIKLNFLSLLLMFFIGITGFAQNLQDLVGDKAAGAFNELRDRGYTYINGSKSGDSAYQNWYNRNQNKCVTVKVNDGRINSIVKSTLEDCGKGKYSNNNNRYNNDYNDSYNNNRYNNNKKNYNGNFDYGYLNRQKATYAYSELRKNGFDEQKTHEQGGNTYKVWFNNDSNQCLKTTSRDEKITSIVVSTHCK